jgi:GNAT superfamily N-acetyltransferase
VNSGTQSRFGSRELSKTGSDPIFLAVADGQIVGLLALHLCRMPQYTNAVVRVTALVVDRRARRCGVGKLLMEHAERMGSAAGCEFVELTSAIDRTEAHAFYGAIGYEPNSLRFRKSLVRRNPSISEDRGGETGRRQRLSRDERHRP